MTSITLPNPDNKYTALMPEMTEDEFAELKADIRHKGVIEALVVDQDNNLIDGRHRWKAWVQLIEEGCDLPLPDMNRRRFNSDEERLDLVLSTNLRRRQLKPDARAQLVFKLRMPPYGLTMEKIGAMLSVNVGTVSRDLASLSDEDKAVLSKAVITAKDGREFSGDGFAPRILFTTGEHTLNKLQSVARGEASSETRTDRLEELLEKYKVEEGQVWYIPSKTRPGSSHRLTCGDSLDIHAYQRLFWNGVGSDKARLVVTSPPYNQNLETFRPTGMQMENDSFVQRMHDAYSDSMPEADYQYAQQRMFALVGQWVTDDASFFYNHKNRIRESEVISPLSWIWRQLEWKLRLEIVWDRSSSITMNARMFVPCDERIYWLRRGEEFYFVDTTEVKAWTTVWRFAARNDQDFSAPFPNELPHRCIVACSELGDIVLDPYSGTGTTITECERLGRVGYGIEISPKYVAGQLERFAQMGLEPTLAPF